jgi:MraZ protein
MLRVNRKGARHEIDSKGRVLLNVSLRGTAKLQEEVEVIGLNNHLEIWNRAVLDEKLEKKPLTDEDFESIAGLIPRGKRE